MTYNRFKTIAMFKVLTLAIFFGALYPAQAQAQVSCRAAFTPSPIFAALASFEAQNINEDTSRLYLKAAEHELNSTTGNRVERKFTATTDLVNQNLLALQDSIAADLGSFKIESRDPKSQGYRNITYTRYLTKLSLAHEGRSLTAKIRLRKYGLISTRAKTTLANFKPVEALIDPANGPFSWLEFKIEHPKYENAVLKPRIKFLDKWTEFLATPARFIALAPRIRFETKVLNSEVDDHGNVILQKDRLVDEMIDALIATLYSQVSLSPISETIYERTSYSINLYDSVKQQKVNIQLTVDRDVHQHSTVLKREVPSYDPSLNLSVLEIKVPVEYAHFRADQLASVVGLGQIQDLIQLMTQAQQEGYKIDKGKFSRAVTILRESL